MKRIFTSVVALVSVFAVCGCGTQLGQLASVGQVSVQELNGYEQFFSEEQIREVYSDATEVRGDGRIWPLSKESTMISFRENDAPVVFTQRYGNFSVGSELRAYIHLGHPQNDGSQIRLVRNIESVSSWKNVLNDEGNPVFADVYAIDENGEPVPDNVDGKAPSVGYEIHPLRMVTKKSVLTMTVDGEFKLSNNGGLVSMDFVNTKNVDLPFVGTIMKPSGFRMEFLTFPYKNGWLVYGGAPVTVEKFADKFNPKETAKMMQAMFRWLIAETIEPLN